MKDFLISYTSSDRPWADWIAWVLEENDYTVTVQAWDLPADNTLIETTHQAIDECQRPLIVLSESYLRSVTGLTPWMEIFQPILASNLPPIAIQVEDTKPVLAGLLALPGPLAQIRTINLSDKSEVEAEQAILAGLHERSAALSGEISAKASLSATLGIGVSAASEKIVWVDENNRPLKSRQHSHTVQFFVEPLTEDLSIEMMQIPAGTFLMGSPENEAERLDREGPQHQVSVPAFFMSKYPVTQAQWRWVASLPQVKRQLKPNPAHFKGDNHPVEKVSWFDAVEFCQRLSQHTGRPYRLPSEAEWEYACRASPIQTSGTPGIGEVRRAETTTPFHFGETITTDLANYRGTDWEVGGTTYLGNYGSGPKGEYRQKTTPVAHFGIANAFGLCDMHGNVYEWCQDQWHDSYKNAPTDGSAWVDKESEENVARVVRGGSWDLYPWGCRSAYRNDFYPRVDYYFIGFRVVCSTPRTLP